MKGYPADVFGIPVEIINFDGATYFVPAYVTNRPPGRALLSRRYIEPPLHDMVRKVFRTYQGSMIHAGTYFGDMLPSFSRAAGEGTVYAFEPVLESYLLAKTIAEVNALENVTLLHAGLGRGLGTAKLNTGNGRLRQGGASHLVKDAEEVGVAAETATVLALDMIPIPDLVLLQLDVEGFELEVLYGAEKTIANHRPVVILEDNEGNCAEFMQNQGYSSYGKVGPNHLWLTPEHAKDLGYPAR